MLTDHERQVLDEISAELEASDPHLAARLGGARFAFWRTWWRRSQSVIGAIAVPAGLVLAVAVLPFSVWIAFAGVGASFWGCVIHADGATQLMRRAVARLPRPGPSRGRNG